MLIPFAQLAQPFVEVFELVFSAIIREVAGVDQDVTLREGEARLDPTMQIVRVADVHDANALHRSPRPGDDGGLQLVVTRQ